VLIGAGTLEFVVGASMGGLWLVLIGWFVLTAARAEELDAMLRGKLAGLRAADVMSTPPVIAPSTMSVGEFIDEYVPKHRHSAYPVQDRDGLVVGVVTLARTMEVDRRERGVTSLAEVVVPLKDVPVAATGDALVAFMQRLDPSTGGQILVFDGASVVGIVTERDVARAAELRDARQLPAP
jgi:CBS-domain-containing membrane protein